MEPMHELPPYGPGASSLRVSHGVRRRRKAPPPLEALSLVLGGDSWRCASCGRAARLARTVAVPGDARLGVSWFCCERSRCANCYGEHLVAHHGAAACAGIFAKVILEEGFQLLIHVNGSGLVELAAVL